ncbi:GxxExxY protein [Chryseobacterium sp. MA9]|uniref:GxxExxY protein n=1 Tax=Chryseobacterium sp. MA9 TaxID=2966625 RepID=UPI00351CE29B
MEVHKNLGVGLLENVYKAALAYELKMQGLNVRQQLSLPLKYKEVYIENAYRIDLIVVVKSVLELHPIFHSQVLTYLKQTNIKLGLLINFNNELIKYGIHRIVNKFIDE